MEAGRYELSAGVLMRAGVLMGVLMVGSVFLLVVFERPAFFEHFV